MKTFREWLKLEVGSFPSRRELEDWFWSLENRRAYGQFEDQEYEEWLKFADALEETGYPKMQEFKRATDALKAVCDATPVTMAMTDREWQNAYMAANEAINAVFINVLRWLKNGQ